LFHRQSVKTFAIVVRSMTLRSVVSSWNNFAADCRRKCFTSIGPPSQRTAARSRTLRKLAHVAEPPVLEKRGSCLAREFGGWSSEGSADLLQKAVA